MAYKYNVSSSAVWLAACGSNTCSLGPDEPIPDPPVPEPCLGKDEPGGGGNGGGSGDTCDECDECEDKEKKDNCCDDETTYTPREIPVTPGGFYDIGGSCSLNFKYKLINGQLYVSANLFSEGTNSAVPLSFSVIWRTFCDKNNLLGVGWNHNYNLQIIETDDGCYYSDYNGVFYFFKYENSQYTSPLFYGMTAVLTKTDGLFRLTYPTGTAYQFNQVGKLDYIQSPELIRIKVIYDSDLQPSEIQAIDISDESYLRTIKFSIDKKMRLIEKITCPDDEEIIFQYNKLNLLESIVTANRCNFTLEYDGKGRLKRVREANGKEYEFSYNSADYLSQYTEAPGTDVERSQKFWIQDPISFLRNAYIEDFKGNQRQIMIRENYRPYRIHDPWGTPLTQWSSGAYNYYYKAYQPDGTHKFKYLEYTGIYAQNNARSKGIIRSDINEDWRGSSYLNDSNDRRIAQYNMNLDIATLGDWTDGTDKVYGKDGFILCAWNDDENWTDYLDEIPSYLDQNTPVEKVDTVQFNGGSSSDERSLLQPSGTGRRATNWDTAAEKNSFTVTINFSSSSPCDITAYSFPTYSYYGREFDINITDKNGTQTLFVHNDFNSIYCRFSVEPDDNNQVVLEFVGAPSYFGYTVPRVSALFFDPQETHVTKYEYNDENYPRKVTKTIDAYGNEATTQYNADGTVAQSSNFRGKVTKYTYTGDSYARITCVEDPPGNKTWTNYDTKGRVISTVDARGSGPDDEDHMTKNEYDANGNLISVTDPLGNKTTYLYDGSGKLISQTDPTGWVTYYNTDDDSSSTEVKDALGRVISSTDRDGKTTYYEYDIDSHLIKITDPNGAISTNTYDAIGRMEASSDFEGNITRYEYDVMGRTTKTTAPDGGETSYEYDVKGRITKTTYPDETTTETTYDIYGNVKTTTDRAGNISENFYDRLNRVIKIKDPEGNYTYYDYDANGNRTAVRDPRSSSATDDTYKISYTYDDNDRLTRIDYPDGTYETTVYDAVGNATSKTDRKGQTTTYTFNNANRLTVITYPDETTTEYTYDAAGRVLSVTQPDGSATYTKSLGNVTREYKLDFEGNLVYDYYTQYDDNGRMIKFIDASNATLATLPAVFNKVKYNENFNKLGYASNAQLGQNFKYGEEGASNRKYRQQEDQDDRVAKFGTILFGTDPIKYAEEAGPGAVLSTKYNYDDGDSEDGSGTGVLKSITDPFGKDYSFQRLENGSRTLYPNNTFTDRTYDEWGRLETIAHKRRETGGAPAGNGGSGSSSGPGDGPGEFGSETVLQSFAYQYDNSGNITKITEANGEYTEYYYDSNLTPRYCGTKEDINGIWGVSSDDVFIAGNNGTILHYNGNLWSPMSSGTAENLRGIWGASSSDIFVVGENGAILHYDGSSWSPMTSGTTENLESVWGASGSNVYAVGTNGKILHYNGSAWSSMSSGTGYNLHSIWGVSANLIFAAGYYGKILRCYNSVNWYSMSSGTTQELRAVWGTSGTDVYAVGDGEKILHYNGTTWKTTTSPVSGYLKALSGFSADNVFAAGNNGSLIHFDGSAWQQLISGFDSDIQAMHMFSATEMFMSGKEGIIRQFTGNANNCGSLNRLAMERRRAEKGNVIYCIEYLFDDNSSKNGNIHRVIYDGKHVTEFQYNEMNELTAITHPDSSTETLTYDNNGNLTQTVNNTTGETTAYEWDCFDRLMKVTLPAKGGATSGETVEFEYDSGGMLIGEKSAGMERKFTQQNRFATRELVKNRNGEWEMSAYHTIHGQMLATHISSNSKKVGMNKVSNETGTIFYHTDHLGSVRLTTDQNGNTINSNTTDAYGNPLPRATAQPNLPPGSPKNKGAKMLSNFNFIGTHGIRYVEKVRLHNMRARWYNRRQERFLALDPIKFATIFNRYRYSNNNPIKFLDYTGMYDESYMTIQLIKSKFNFQSAGITLKNDKLCKVFGILYDVCPKVFNTPPCKSFIISPSSPSAATYFPDFDAITIGYQYWNIQSEMSLAFAIMEELIHAQQRFDMINQKCGDINCYKWLTNQKIYINNIQGGGRPKMINIINKDDKGEYLLARNAAFEVWAQYAKIVGMNENESYKDENMYMQTILFLNLFRFQDPYFPIPNMPPGNPNNFDNYYGELINITSSTKYLPEAFLSMINMEPKQAYSKYCQ